MDDQNSRFFLIMSLLVYFFLPITLLRSPLYMYSYMQERCQNNNGSYIIILFIVVVSMSSIVIPIIPMMFKNNVGLKLPGSFMNAIFFSMAWLALSYFTNFTPYKKLLISEGIGLLLLLLVRTINIFACKKKITNNDEVQSCGILGFQTSS